MSKFLSIGAFKRIYPKAFDSNKYNSDSLNGCVLDDVLEYTKELRELHNDYPLAPDKT